MLNTNCKYDVSDEDCYRCMKRGIVFSCPTLCEHFEDARERAILKKKDEEN